MKVFYLNDETKPLTVKVRKKDGEPWEWDFIVLAPQEGRVFEVYNAKPGDMPWLKRWDKQLLMISCINSPLVGGTLLSSEQQ